MLRCGADPRVISQVTAMLALPANASPFCKNIRQYECRNLVRAGAPTVRSKPEMPPVQPLDACVAATVWARSGRGAEPRN